MLPPKEVGEWPLQVATNNGRNAAHRAARTGGLGMLRAMSELGCPIADKNLYRSTAAFFAAQAGHVEALRVLSGELGCSLAEKSNDGRTAAHVAAQGGLF